MARDFEGRIALVTGAGSGIGAVIARRLADEGASVAVADLNPEAAATIVSEIGRQAAPRERSFRTLVIRRRWNAR